MRLTALQISKSVLMAMMAALLLSSCASEPVSKISSRDKVLRKNINQKVFYFPYDSVWRAAQLAVKYPISVNNMDNGILETEYIRASEGFSSPVEEREPSSGVRYKITLVLAKGRVNNKESVRVTVTKAVEKNRDFFSESEALPSDGLEEKVIFYRLERELLIEEALKKAK